MVYDCFIKDSFNTFESPFLYPGCGILLNGEKLIIPNALRSSVIKRTDSHVSHGNGEVVTTSEGGDVLARYEQGY